MAVAEVLTLAMGAIGEELHHLAAQRLSLYFEKPLMDEVRMISVDAVFHLEFPVAVVTVLMRAGARFDRALGRQVHKQVDVVFCACQIVHEAFDLGTQTREHQPAIFLYARGFEETELALVETRTIAARVRNASELALMVVCPAVI